MSDETVTINAPGMDVSPAEAEAPMDPNPSEKLVPVTESIRYRRRAQAAEQQLAELRTKFDDARQELDETRRQLDDTERRRRIDQLLVASDAIDLDAARLLTEAAVETMDDADVDAAVAELRRTKPYLFAGSSGTSAAGGGTMSPRPRGGDRSQVETAAEAAASSGNRRDLLRYLRMRRQRTA